MALVEDQHRKIGQEDAVLFAHAVQHVPESHAVLKGEDNSSQGTTHLTDNPSYERVSARKDNSLQGQLISLTVHRRTIRHKETIRPIVNFIRGTMHPGTFHFRDNSSPDNSSHGQLHQKDNSSQGQFISGTTLRRTIRHKGDDSSHC